MGIVIGALALGLVYVSMQKKEIIPTPTPVTSAELGVFSAIPYWDQARAVSVFKKYVRHFDGISLFWYRLSEDGSIVPYASAVEDLSIITFAHANDVQVFALIANLPENGDWDAGLVGNVIGSKEKRKKHIASIVALVQAKDFDGANIDYEFLEESQTGDFTAFVKELGSALHAKGKLLAVAVHAQRPEGERRGQDIPSLTGADILVLMTYDEHWETSDPGAMASLPWMREVLSYMLRIGVPMKKVYFGIPLDGYDWPFVDPENEEWGEARGLQYEEAATLARMRDVEIEFDDRAKAPNFTYEDRDGLHHEVWFENAQSFEPKFDLAKEFGVGGVALWRLGREDQRIYEVIAED